MDKTALRRTLPVGTKVILVDSKQFRNATATVVGYTLEESILVLLDVKKITHKIHYKRVEILPYQDVL